MREEKPSNYIVDASFMLSYLLPDERVEKVGSVFQLFKEGRINFISNLLLPFEITNGLKYAIKSKRIDKKTAYNLIRAFLSYEITFEEVDLTKVLALSIDKELTVYDAAYLYLAHLKQSELLTLDEKLQKLV